MDDWRAIAIRFATYAALCLAFGVPLRSLSVRDAPLGRRPLALLVIAALGCSALHLLVLVAAMAGTAMIPVDGETLRVVLTDTPFGTTFVVRFAALVAALAMLGWPRIGNRLRVGGVAACAAVALATLAWAGHGAMDEGWRGDLHLAADIVHLLAAGAWIGAIAAMLAMLVRGAPADAAHALERFAPTGSILIALLVATGVVNGAMIFGTEVPAALGTLYGRLLLAKVALFAAMLVAAALNRWMLTPRMATRALRTSLAIELALGLFVLAAVGWLGTLSPES